VQIVTNGADHNFPSIESHPYLHLQPWERRTSSA
jgi:hypothetical protein